MLNVLSTHAHLGRELLQLEELLAHNNRGKHLLLTYLNSIQQDRSTSAADELVGDASCFFTKSAFPGSTTAIIPTSTSLCTTDYDDVLESDVPVVASEGEITRQEVLRHEMKIHGHIQKRLDKESAQHMASLNMIFMQPKEDNMSNFLLQIAELKANNPSIFGKIEIPLSFFDSGSESEKLNKIYQLIGMSIVGTSISGSSSQVGTIPGNQPLVTSSRIFTHSFNIAHLLSCTHY